MGTGSVEASQHHHRCHPSVGASHRKDKHQKGHSARSHAPHENSKTNRGNTIQTSGHGGSKQRVKVNADSSDFSATTRSHDNTPSSNGSKGHKFQKSKPLPVHGATNIGGCHSLLNHTIAQHSHGRKDIAVMLHQHQTRDRERNLHSQSAPAKNFMEYGLKGTEKMKLCPSPGKDAKSKMSFISKDDFFAGAEFETHPSHDILPPPPFNWTFLKSSGSQSTPSSPSLMEVKDSTLSLSPLFKQWGKNEVEKSTEEVTKEKKKAHKKNEVSEEKMDVDITKVACSAINTKEFTSYQKPYADCGMYARKRASEVKLGGLPMELATLFGTAVSVTS